MLFETLFNLFRFSLALSLSQTWQRYYNLRRFSTADSSGEELTARDVQQWSVGKVAEYCQCELKLSSKAVSILEKQKVSGKSLLGLSKADMKHAGLPVGAIDNLLSFINKLLDTGEKTVYINLAAAGEDAVYEPLTFKDAEDLKEFLRDQGASGLKSGDGQGLIRAFHYNKIKNDGKYTVEFANGGFETEVDQVKEYADSSAKALVAKVRNRPQTWSPFCLPAPSHFWLPRVFSFACRRRLRSLSRA
jgi:hypothetical protein